MEADLSVGCLIFLLSLVILQISDRLPKYYTILLRPGAEELEKIRAWFGCSKRPR